VNVDSIENIVLNNVWAAVGVNGFGCAKIGVFWIKKISGYLVDSGYDFLAC